MVLRSLCSYLRSDQPPVDIIIFMYINILYEYLFIYFYMRNEDSIHMK